MGERRFAGARRAVKNSRFKAVGLDSAAQKLSGAEDVFLACEFVKLQRGQARGERRPLACGRAAGGAFKKRVVHIKKR